MLVGADQAPDVEDKPTRRDFLYIFTGSMTAIGVANAIWPFIDQMEPDASVIAAGVPIDVDIGQMHPGQQIRAVWRGRPIFVVNRTNAVLDALQNPKLLALLADPQSTQQQQPPYAVNWHRSIKPELSVLVGICTHLGCIPQFQDQLNGAWFAGYFCPCHGSKYDLAGRVFSGVPAPYNLPVPPYRYINEKTLRIGENPEGTIFEFGSIDQV